MRHPAALALLVAPLLALPACGSDEEGEDDDEGGGAAAGATGTGGSSAGGAAGSGGSAGADAGAFPGPEPMGCIQDVGAGTHVYECDTIRYDTRVPEACLTSACGLVFDVHGFSMSGAMEEANTKMQQLGEQHGYLVVQPNAPGNPPLSSWTPGTDDAKVFAMVELVRDVFHVDETRIHFTGFSQGGAMTWRMLCAHADTFASVAPGAASGCAFDGADTPSEEVDVLYLHGHEDALVDFDMEAIPQRDAVIAGWSLGAGEVVDSGDGFVRTRYTSASGTHFEFLEHDYAAGPCIVTIDGHCFPGSDDPGGLPGQACSFACLPPNGFTWGEEAMQFFLDHPKR